MHATVCSACCRTRFLAPPILTSCLIALLLLWVTTSVGGAQTLTRFTIDSWSSTTNYLGFAEFESAIDGQIRITAADSYSLYVNGDFVGSDDDPNTVESYEVSYKRRTNQIAVVVNHGGKATGFGLFCVLEAEGVQIVSSPTDRSAPWFWTNFSLDNEEDADWMALRSNRLDSHTEDVEVDGEEVELEVPWSPVQAGNFDIRSIPALSDIDLTRVESLAGFAGGLDGSRGALQLRTLAGVNAAFGTQSAEPRLVDGNVNTSLPFRRGAAALLQRAETDLGRLVVITRVRVITEPPSRGSYEDASLSGYSILVSKDGVNFLEVASRNQITNFLESEVNFPAVPARHVRLVVTEFSSRSGQPRVGEMEVYGEGIAQTGSFLSQALDLGTDAPKNFERVEWFGEVPDQSSLEMRFRSSADADSWSDWSAWSGDPVIPTTVPEPRQWLQFHVRMETRDLFAGPTLDSLAVYFLTDGLPVTSAQAAITPTVAPIGVDTTFTYDLELDVQEGDLGVARLVIVTPWPAELDIAGIRGLAGGVTVDAAQTYATNDSLVVAFSPAIDASAGITALSIPFTTRLMSASHRFEGLLFAPGSTFALLVEEKESDDPELVLSLVTEARDFSIPVLSDVSVHPEVFTPNGDMWNETAAIGFTLGRVSGAAVRLEIYDLSGTLVHTTPESLLDAGRYAPLAGRAVDLPLVWNGRDDDDDLVPPGVYIYRLVVDLDPEDETSVGVIGVVY